jgi:ArsR family transcriptional regulator, arsenate/arsenite/antimonite-responsive transcriptional repressor
MLTPLTFAKVIADETRQQIMSLLCCQQLCVSDIVEQTAVSQPTVSHHLNILRDAGLVSSERSGKQIFYTLNQAAVVSCCGRLVQNFAPNYQTIPIMIEDQDQ